MKYLYTKLWIWWNYDSFYYKIRKRYRINKIDKFIKGLSNSTDFNQTMNIWFWFFKYTLKRDGFNNKSIKELFYHWEMANWKAMHQENTEYKGKTKEELFDFFVGDAAYCSDRMSYDRLFRCHWLFRQTFKEEFNSYINSKL